jgi:hypothetical protein
MDARDFLVGDNLVSVADYAASVVKKGAAVV